jgi:predicted nucleotidyltransferase
MDVIFFENIFPIKNKLSKSFSLKVDIIDNHAFNEITKSKKKKKSKIVWC